MTFFFVFSFDMMSLGVDIFDIFCLGFNPASDILSATPVSPMVSSGFLMTQKLDLPLPSHWPALCSSDWVISTAPSSGSLTPSSPTYS